MVKILVILGPNLNLIGKREKNIYGIKSYEEINKKIEKKAKSLGFEIIIKQSNHEGEIIDFIQEAKKINYIIINPGAYTHYSIAIRDALMGMEIPSIEVHMSNIYAREEFRKKSIISDIVIGSITGFSYHGYLMAIDYIREVEKK